MAEHELPLATVNRIAKKNGVERIGEDATVALVDLSEKYIVTIAKSAQKLAEHAGRKTVKSEDILLAAGQKA